MASTTDSNNQSKRTATSGATTNGTTINGVGTAGAATDRASEPANAAPSAAVEPDMNGRADVPNRTEEAVSSTEAEPVPQVGDTSSDDTPSDDVVGDVAGDLMEAGTAEAEEPATGETEAEAAEADTDITEVDLPDDDAALQDLSEAVDPALDLAAGQAEEQVVVETETRDNDAHDDAGLNEELAEPAVVVADEDGAAALTGDVEAGAEESTESEAAPSAERVERLAVIMNAVKIRGRPGGVAIEIGEGDWSELLEVLQERLEMAEGFFRGGRVVLDVGDRAIGERELRQAFEVLEGFEMQMAVVRSDEERTLEAAVALGVTASAGEAEDPMRAVVESHAEELAGQAPPYFVHEGNLRSGQILQREESIIVIGDVNPGAQVISHGDVLIWGRLRGSVHAGAEGNLQAVVTALEFAPTQLRIAKLTSVPPEEKKQGRGLLFWKKEAGHGAEFAYVSEDRIYVEPWNSARPGSLTSRRR